MRQGSLCGVVLASLSGCMGLVPEKKAVDAQIVESWSEGHDFPEDATPEDHVRAVSRYLFSYIASEKEAYERYKNKALPVAQRAYTQLSVHLPTRFRGLSSEQAASIKDACRLVYVSLEDQKRQWSALPIIHEQYGLYGGDALFQDIAVASNDASLKFEKQANNLLCLVAKYRKA